MHNRIINECTINSLTIFFGLQYFSKTQCDMALQKAQSFLQQQLLSSRFCESFLFKPFSPYTFLRVKKSVLHSQLTLSTIRIHRKLSPLDLTTFKNISLWSQSHLHNLRKLKDQIAFSEAVLCNPYKSYELIQESFYEGINKMVVCDLQEIEKIHNIRFNLMKKTLKQYQTNLLWKVTDLEQDLHTLSTINDCDFGIRGLSIKIDEHQKKEFLEEIIHYFKSMGYTLKYLNLQTTSDQIEKKFNLIEMLKRNLPSETSCNLQITDIDQTGDFRILCKIIGMRNPHFPIFHQQCYQFIEREPGIPGKIMEIDGNKWFLCQPTNLDNNRSSYIEMI